MTAKLTERDKKLLVFLSIFVIAIVFGYFIIRPLANDISKLRLDIENAEMEKMEKENKVILLPSSRIVKKTLEERISASAKDFYEPMQSQEIDRLLTTAALNYHLSARKLSISMPTGDMQLLPYFASAAAVGEPEGGSSFTGLRSVTLTMEVAGVREDLQAFLDELFNGYPAIRVTSYSWSGLKQNEDTDSYLLNLGLALYIYEDYLNVIRGDGSDGTGTD